MAYKVKYSEQAVDDLDEIIRYISQELLSPQSADNFFKAVYRKLGFLRENPYMYPLHNDDKLASDGYRFVVIGNYYMFYLVDDVNSIVNIARILYGKRDISLSLFQHEENQLWKR